MFVFHYFIFSLFCQALYYTGNRSVNAATNWIFDHPELDLETPLEEEIKRLQAEELEEDCLEEEEDEEDSEVRKVKISTILQCVFSLKIFPLYY